MYHNFYFLHSISSFLIACISAKSLQSCPTLCDPMGSSSPGSSVHEIFPGKNTGVGCHFLLRSDGHVYYLECGNGFMLRSFSRPEPGGLESTIRK